MDLEFKKKIEERMKQLPSVLAKAIKASNWESIVFDIGRRHSLHVDDIGDLQNELILVLTGIVHPDEFRHIVISEIGIPEDKADVIIEEINDQVNEKIKNELKSIMDDADEDKTVDTESGELAGSEKEVLRDSGIRLGDDVDETANQHTPPVADGVEAPTVAVQAPKPEPKPVNPVTAKIIAEPQVFKTRISPAEVGEAGRGFSDPYREPVE